MAVTNRWRASRLDCAPLLGAALDRGPPGRGQDRRQGEHRQHGERRVDRHQQPDRHGQPQDPPRGGEERHVHVVEHEHLVAEHGQTVEVVGPLLVGDGRHRRLQAGDVGLEGDRHPVAEAALDPGADRAQDPGGGRRHTEADRGDDEQAPVAVEHPVAEELEPQRQERVRERGGQGQHEGGDEQPRLVAVAELAQPPHRRQRRGQVLGDGQGGAGVSRGCHRRRPPRLRWRRTAGPGGRTSCGSGLRAPSARRGCRARGRGRARARRCGRRGAPWRTGAR